MASPAAATTNDPARPRPIIVRAAGAAGLCWRMRIEEFDPAADDGKVRACYHMYAAGLPCGRPGRPADVADRVRRLLREGWAGDPRQAALASDHDGTPVGGYLLELPRRDNTHVGSLTLWCRRAGGGAATAPTCCAMRPGPPPAMAGPCCRRRPGEVPPARPSPRRWARGPCWLTSGGCLSWRDPGGTAGRAPQPGGGGGARVFAAALAGSDAGGIPGPGGRRCRPRWPTRRAVPGEEAHRHGRRAGQQMPSSAPSGWACACTPSPPGATGPASWPA